MTKPPKRTLVDLEIVSLFLSELFGTAILVYLSCSGSLTWHPSIPVNGLQAAFCSGFAVLICVQIFGSISGAHINPCVTVAALICDSINIKTAVIYFIAQLVGAFMGFGTLLVLTPAGIIEQSGPSFGVTVPHADVSAWNACCIEFVATSILIWFCCAIWDPRNARVQDSVPIRFGLAVTGLASVTSHYTGGSFNPARSLAPAIWNNDFTSHWVYWIGPITGAIVSTIVYKYVFRHNFEAIRSNGRPIDVEMEKIETTAA